MPALVAVIGANADPMRRELKSVEAMAATAGQRIRVNLEAGGTIRTGAMRETLVLLREISRGNWTRVPGSLSLLIQNLGIFSGATTAAVGILGTFGSILVGVAAAITIVYGRIKLLSEALTGLKLPDFNPEYISKHAQRINAIAEGWKTVNKEVEKSVELYNSASKQAERVSAATKEHFEHLRKMNAIEDDPSRRAAGELEIDKQERAAVLADKQREIFNLELEGEQRKRKADAINVPSAEQDAELVRQTAGKAKEGREFLLSHEQFGGFGDKATATFAGGLSATRAQEAFRLMSEADRKKVSESRDAIKANQDAINRRDENNEQRQKREELVKGSGESFAKAAVLHREIQDQMRTNAQRDKDQAEEMAAAGARRGGSGQRANETLTELQKIGAFIPINETLSVHKQTLHVVKEIRDKIGSGRGSSRGLETGVKY